MTRSQRIAAAAAQRRQPARMSSRVAKVDSDRVSVKQELVTSPEPTRPLRKRTAPELGTPVRKKMKKEIKSEQSPEPRIISVSPTSAAAAALRAKKLKSYTQHFHRSPFPDFPHPTPEECKLAHRILASLHGARDRPARLVASTTRAGCGDSPSVLDALVRTILSQNTSDTNSSRAKRSMDQAYGRSDNWDVIAAGGQERLQEVIKCGGLSKVKSKVIIDVLEQVHSRYGEYSLDRLHEASTEKAMEELLSFQGVGPKTASCVILFSLGRESFAVDTHVWRITGLLGWRPAQASRDETHLHLDAKIPDEDKYGLHILLVTHGKICEECKAGGKNLNHCELRKAFKKGKLEGEDMIEEETSVKQEA